MVFSCGGDAGGGGVSLVLRVKKVYVCVADAWGRGSTGSVKWCKHVVIVLGDVDGKGSICGASNVHGVRM